ncbi:sensor histidine kinase [Actinokineospora spheciospongiae]|uniref:sensor histidine kinase n=1 Tax=Actinokineospora spheciospongiae TaxID=909613 RepID=UPI000D8F6ECC|nr:histidine kinase [Actinokineospora spheciospongiae]PWW56979.1 signal transduction histidine kinase [Actinokineospora spheciospongiae]
MPQRQSGPARGGRDATAPEPVPEQRAGAHDRSELRGQHTDTGTGTESTVDRDTPGTTAERGGAALVAHAVTPDAFGPAEQRGEPGSADLLPRVALRWPRWPAALRVNRVLRGLLGDLLAMVVAALDVWLVIPPDAPPWSIWLSWLAVPAMLLRRHVPFVALLVAIPGFFYGWAQLAAMIALGSLARLDKARWRTWVGAALVWVSRFVVWPWADFVATTWREHILDAIYGVIVAGMPLAIGLLLTMRSELFARIRQLDRSREREKRLYAATVRSAERAKLAREMHDVVSHQVTLIAMQAGALQVGARDDEAREGAETIRVLSTRTLEELRELVGVLRSGGDEVDAQPGLEEVGDLVDNDDVKINVAIDASPEQLPGPVSRAAYRTVQEALTNVRKHASGSRASVRVRTSGEALLVEVHNDRPRRRRGPGLPSGGHGLLGLRERATLLGGTFDAGPTAEGGFRVRATYPLVG